MTLLTVFFFSKLLSDNLVQFITARKRNLGQGLCLGVSLQGISVWEGGSLSGGSLSWGVSVQGGLCLGVSLWGGLCLGSLSRGSLSRGSLSGGSLSEGSLSRGISVRETPRTVRRGRYASYWNAFLSNLNFDTLL